MPEAVVIRLATIDDWEHFRHIRLEALRDSPDAFGSTWEEERGYVDEFFRDQLDPRSPWRVYLAFHRGRSVGMARGGPHELFPGQAWLFGMYVSPRFRASGLAAELVAAVSTRAQRRGFDELHLMVAADAVPRALSFYRRVGFVPTGFEKRMNRDVSIRLVEMTMPLAAARFEIAIVEPERLYELRRRVLRGGRFDAVVADPRDHEETALHLAGLIEGEVVVSSSFYPSVSPTEPELSCYQLRYLACDFDVQRRGYAEAVMSFAEKELRGRSAQALWANGRDSALDFYRRTGWKVISGSEHLSPETQLPHTVITRRLDSATTVE